MDTTLSRSGKAPTQKAVTGRIFFLDLGGGRVLSANPDGSDLKTIVEEGRKLPDGLVVDSAARHMYWTNMGNPIANDGSILRSDLDGKNMTTVIPPGGTFTPKQLQLEKESGKLYWCDREGMRVMRANLDGSNIETLVDTSQGDPRPGQDLRKWCVGIAVDAAGGKFYWTRREPIKPARVASSARISSSPEAGAQRTAETSNSSMTTCQSRSIWTSIGPLARSTGPIVGIRLAAIP